MGKWDFAQTCPPYILHGGRWAPSPTPALPPSLSGMPWAEQAPQLFRKAFWSPFHFQPCASVSSVNAGGRETISKWVLTSWFCISGCLVTTLCKLRVVHRRVPRRVTPSPDSETWIWLVQKVGLGEAASLLGSHLLSSVPSTYLSLLDAFIDLLPSSWPCDHVQPCHLQHVIFLEPLTISCFLSVGSSLSHCYPLCSLFIPFPRPSIHLSVSAIAGAHTCHWRPCVGERFFCLLSLQFSLLGVPPSKPLNPVGLSSSPFCLSSASISFHVFSFRYTFFPPFWFPYCDHGSEPQCFSAGRSCLLITRLPAPASATLQSNLHTKA